MLLAASVLLILLLAPDSYTAFGVLFGLVAAGIVARSIQHQGAGSGPALSIGP